MRVFEGNVLRGQAHLVPAYDAAYCQSGPGYLRPSGAYSGFPSNQRTDFHAHAMASVYRCSWLLRSNRGASESEGTPLMLERDRRDRRRSLCLQPDRLPFPTGQVLRVSRAAVVAFAIA